MRFVESTLWPQNRQTVFASGHSFVEVIKNDFGEESKFLFQLKYFDVLFVDFRMSQSTLYKRLFT